MLLRLIVGAPDECLDMMEKMRPVMLDEFMRKHLYRKAESIFVDSGFLEAVAGSHNLGEGSGDGVGGRGG